MQLRDIHFAVEQLNTAYARCIDSDRLEDWPEFFTQSCFYNINPADSVERGLPIGLMYADSRAMLTDRVTALRKANIYEAQRYRHLISSLTVLDTKDLTAVRTEASFLVVRTMQAGDSVVFCSGVYADLIDLSGEEALFRERRVICDSERIDTLLAIPI